MSKEKEQTQNASEFITEGILVEKGVRISDKQSMDELSARGYGVVEKKRLMLTLYEALYLLDKGTLKVEDRKHVKQDFQAVLQRYQCLDENAWAKYLIYRDLRSRGYVVREGFGGGVDFRVYERGEYSKDTAKYLIASIQEGKPMPIGELTTAVTQSLSLKKELVLAVMNRRGEIVYYSISELNFK